VKRAETGQIRPTDEAELVPQLREDDLEGWVAHLESDFRANALNRLAVSLTPRGRVLDAGCGRGLLSAELIRSGREVVSLDPSPRRVEMCRAFLGRLGLDRTGVRRGGVEEIEDPGSFDAVVSLDVIEHIEDDLGALRGMHRALKPTGSLVLSVPALPRLYGPKDLDVGHYRRYDRAGLSALLDRAGFEVRSSRYWNLLGVAPVWVRNRRGERVDESFRYSRSPAQRALNRALRVWFEQVENRIHPPVGLTVVVTACPRQGSGP
jgi:SAM-dependent methyltransferase